ncbi:MAG: M48 family metalloprotease [Desulfobacterales bacterium]|nr:M48 family metalloprotease [Desulfobacterales bacterium]
MFANYLYFILALLTYATLSESKSNFSFSDSLFGSTLVLILYVLLVLISFRVLERFLRSKSYHKSELLFGRIKVILAISAIIFFGGMVNYFNASYHLNQLLFFKTFPTATATIFLSIFILMLAFLWAVENNSQKKIFSVNIPAKDYVKSNLSFPAVILVTWILIFLPMDIINSLPFDTIKIFFNSLLGQISYSIITFICVLTYGPFLVQKIWGCSPLEKGEARDIIEKICIKKKVKYKEILIWPFFGGHIITAGVMGVFGRFRYLLVTPALIKYLTNEELESVMAHEIGHVKHWHLALYLFFLSGFFLIINLIMEPLIGLFKINNAEIVVVIMVLSFGLYFRFFFGYIMRNFERQADAFVLTVFKSAEPIIQTFQKITSINKQPEDKPNWHHFSIKERIDFLRSVDQDRSLIEKHNKKVKKIVVSYILVFFVLFGFNIYNLTTFNHSALYKQYILTDNLITGNEVQIASALGDFYYRNGNYVRTVKSYWKVIEAAPTNTHALNNLAWLYLTCEEERFLDFQKALELAERASTLKQSKEIMDTLAEAFFRNKMYNEAVDASKISLKLSGNETYYKKQLEKFERVAKQIRI